MMHRHMVVLIGILVIICGCVGSHEGGNNDEMLSSLRWERTVIRRVIDGDTVRLVDGRRVRLIGINAPEMGDNEEPFAVEAAEWLRVLVEGKTVYLQKDVSETDRFDRLLRYIWLEKPDQINEDTIRGLMINAMIVAEGYAQPYTFPPDVLFSDLFLKLAREARDSEKGLWALDSEGTTRGTPLD